MDLLPRVCRNKNNLTRCAAGTGTNSSLSLYPFLRCGVDEIVAVLAADRKGQTICQRQRRLGPGPRLGAQLSDVPGGCGSEEAAAGGTRKRSCAPDRPSLQFL